MQTIIGTLLDVTERPREWEGRKWTEHVAHVLDGVHTTEVTLQGPSRDGRSAGLDPALLKPHNGERVCLEVYGRGGGNKRVYLTATRVLDADALADSLGLVSV